MRQSGVINDLHMHQSGATRSCINISTWCLTWQFDCPWYSHNSDYIIFCFGFRLLMHIGFYFRNIGIDLMYKRCMISTTWILLHVMLSKRERYYWRVRHVTFDFSSFALTRNPSFCGKSLFFFQFGRWHDVSRSTKLFKFRYVMVICWNIFSGVICSELNFMNIIFNRRRLIHSHFSASAHFLKNLPSGACAQLVMLSAMLSYISMIHSRSWLYTTTCRTTCSTCNTITRAHSPMFKRLSVAINDTSLVSCLDDFTKEETLNAKQQA